MADESSSFAGLNRRPAGRHVLAGAMAVVLSIGLHAWLLDRMPPLRLGRPMAEEELARFRPFEMDRRPAPRAEPVQEPARFQPQNPDQFREIFGEPEMPAEWAKADLPAPESPALPDGPMTAQDKALVSPALPTTSTPWEPRQDIVQVEERLYADEVSALPRRLVERVERSPVAPDIVLPVLSSDVTPAGGFGSGSGADALSVSLPLSDHAVAGGSWKGGAGPGPSSDTLFPGETSTFDEERARVTGMEPTEQLLLLDVSTFQPPDEPDAVYFQVLIARRAEQSLPILPKDVLFMVDSSESMTAWKLLECKAGVRRWVDQLRDGDRFEIMGFRDAPYRCFNDWAPFNVPNRTRAFRFLDEMRAQGNTDIYASLTAARQMPRDPTRPLIAVLVTDGRPTVGTTDSSDIIESFTQANSGQVSMFAYGAGRRVNRFLLDLLSYRNRGDSLVVVDTDRIPSTMERWGREIARPVLSDLSYRFSGLDETQVYPSTLTHLYLDRPLAIYGRAPRDTDRTAFQVVGRSATETRDLLFELKLAETRAGGPDIRTRWVWHKAYDLIGRFIQTRDAGLWAQIRDLAQRHRLDIPYGRDGAAAGAP